MGKQREKKETEERVNFADLARAEDELMETKRQYGLEEEAPLWRRLGDCYFDWKERREKHLIKRRTYLILSIALGWAGGHRFYEKRWILGLLYLAFFWTAFPAAMAFVDFLIALPMKPDEDGCILI